MSQETPADTMSSPSPVDDALPVCYRHPEVETGLRCNRCNQPICPQCARRSPVGFRCPDCVADVQKRYYSNVKGYINPYDRPLSAARVSPALLAIIALVWLLMEMSGGSTTNEVLVQFGANFGPLIFEGEYWRLFTSMFLHIGGRHLIFNSIGLVAFGFEMERMYGSWRYLVIYLLAGLLGNLASFAVKGPLMFSAGASGAIFGILGVQLAFFLLYRQQFGQYSRQRIQMVLVISGLSLLFGFVAPVDHVAHFGGLAAGFVLGYGLAPRYRSAPATADQRFIDDGSLTRRWWIPLLAAFFMIGGTAIVLSVWRLLFGVF